MGADRAPPQLSAPFQDLTAVPTQAASKILSISRAVSPDAAGAGSIATNTQIIILITLHLQNWFTSQNFAVENPQWGDQN
jgi:hypothetical protein